MFSANSSQVSEDRLYVEDVFSTYLYTGNGSTQTITNGIDLAGKGGMIWLKNRTQAASHFLFDTLRGPFSLTTNNTLAAGDYTGFQSFTSSGFSIGATGSYNLSGDNYASWTFRKAPKFFDVVTFTGTGSGQVVSHSLGATPAFVLIKTTGVSGSWWAVHRSSNGFMTLNATSAAAGTTAAGIGPINDPNPWLPADETSFKPSNFITSGQTAVAYIFAHDTTSDGIIQCGSFTSDGSGAASVTLGWEPQWLLFKRTDATQDWIFVDNMRGFSQSNLGLLNPNNSNAETQATGNLLFPTATGFQGNAGVFSANAPHIYIAIRRGPMRTPTSGTSVFSPIARSGTGAATNITSNINQDVVWQNWRSGGLGSADHFAYDRLRGFQKSLFLNLTSAESTQTVGISALNNTGYSIAGAGSMNNASGTYVDYTFTRAPSFFDEVCYTGTGVARTINHNLGVAPELMIVKSRSNTRNWICYASPIGSLQHIVLNSTGTPVTTNLSWNDTSPTASVFTVGTGTAVNFNAESYVAYLFASCPGVSKVGSYTGNGSSQTINCGFAAGARFVMIKRTDSTGDWYVWDTARGIVSGNDPHLSLNTTAAEVTTDDSVDTDSSGFVVNQDAATNINVSSATYIYLAVA